MSDDKLASAFKRAADLILTGLSSDVDQPHPDGLYMPIAYLCRHSLELHLKYLIRLTAQIGLLEIPADEQKSLNNHSLDSLWRIARRALERQWPNKGDGILDNVQSVIEELHKIDKDGQSLRYSLGKDKSIHYTGYPASVEMRRFMQTFSGVHNFLEACIDHFHKS